MAEPVSQGLGQGAAQVFDTSSLANLYGQQQMAKADAQARMAARKQKIEDELRGRYDELLKTDAFYTRDGEALMKLWDENRKKFEGRWEDIAKGNTQAARDYNDSIMDYLSKAQSSKEAKEHAKNMRSLIQDNPDAFDQGDMDVYNKFVSEPLNFDYPTLIPNVDYDFLGEFKKNVIGTLDQQLANKKQSGGYVNDKGELVNYSSQEVTDEEKDNVIQSWFNNNPKAQQWLAKKYQDEISQGVDPIEIVNREFKPLIGEMKITDYSKTPLKDGGKELIFDEASITDKVPYGGEFMGEAEGITYQTGKDIKSSIPLSKNVYTTYNQNVASGKVDVNTLTYSSPTIVKVDSEGKVIPKGSNKQGSYKIVVPFSGKVGTGKRDKEGNEITDYKTMYRPFNEVKDAFRQAGYDVDRIESELEYRAKYGAKSPEKAQPNAGTGKYPMVENVNE